MISASRFRQKLDAEPFTPLGISRPTVTWTVRPGVKLRESVLVRFEKELGFTAFERDEWLMRRVAASVRPIKDNFLVLQFTDSAGHKIKVRGVVLFRCVCVS